MLYAHFRITASRGRVPQHVINDVTDQWRRRLTALVDAEGDYFERGFLCDCCATLCLRRHVARQKQMWGQADFFPVPLP